VVVFIYLIWFIGFFFQIVWDWDLSEEEEVLDVVVQAQNFGG